MSMMAPPVLTTALAPDEVRGIFSRVLDPISLDHRRDSSTLERIDNSILATIQNSLELALGLSPKTLNVRGAYSGAHPEIEFELNGETIILSRNNEKMSTAKGLYLEVRDRLQMANAMTRNWVWDLDGNFDEVRSTATRQASIVTEGLSFYESQHAGTPTEAGATKYLNIFKE